LHKANNPPKQANKIAKKAKNEIKLTTANKQS
jgi:hypothetical protein